MMKKAKTYLASIQAAATERELTGIELMFKQDMSINCDDLGTSGTPCGTTPKPCSSRTSFSSGREPRWMPTTT